MANEINVNVTLTTRKGLLNDQESATATVTMSGTHLSHGVQTIATSNTTIGISADVATLGYAFFQNQDANNYVDIGIVVSSTFYPVMRLKAGEPALLRLTPGVTYVAKANTAAIPLEWKVVED